jgi:hypothetical protein
MSKPEYIEHLLSILCYDTMIDHLSIAGRYWTHREIINNYRTTNEQPIVTDAPSSVLQISDALVRKNWKRPELRFNSAREIEVKINKEWQAFKPEDYV